MEKQVKGDKFWRGLALILLCGLVYYLSYDNGRKDARAEMESLRRQAVAMAEDQRQEIMRLQGELANCGPRGAGDQSLWNRLPLRTGQSRIIFNNRLVLTLLKVENADNRALVQLNFIEEERLATEEMGAGTSLKFSLNGQEWALVLSTLAQSSANFDIIPGQGRAMALPNGAQATRPPDAGESFPQ